MLAAADTVRLVKARPTLRSAADQYAYGEKAFWAWDWNLAFPHLVLGVDWDGIFGYGYDRERSTLEVAARTFGYWKSGIPAPATDTKGYALRLLGADGSVKQETLHKPMVDRTIQASPFSRDSMAILMAVAAKPAGHRNIGQVSPIRKVSDFKTK